MRESLLVMAAGAVFTLCVLPAFVRGEPQSGSAARPPRGAQNTGAGKKADAGGERGRRKPDLPIARDEKKPDPPPTPTPSPARAETQSSARAEATPAATATPAAQTTPEGEADEAGEQAASPSLVATARGLLDDWGLPAAAAGIGLGLVALLALAVYTFKLRGRVSDLEGQLQSINSRLRGGGDVSTPGQAVAWGVQATAADTFDRGGGVHNPTPEDNEQGQAAKRQDFILVLADAIDEVTKRVEELEQQRQSAVPAGGPQPPEGEATDAEEAEAPAAFRPPQMVTVERMVEWANCAGLRLERVKATFGLFGNFSRSDEGDNWLAIADGDSYLFPRVNRFESGSHFNSNYFDYYDCDNPSAGTVLIDRPATMSSDPQGGWKLVHKGKLSVIAS